jgi:nicotinamidase/pyrazinamidase
MVSQRFSDRDVLIVTDLQNDFLPGGALAVPDGDAIIEPINALAKRFPHVVLTQDWHVPGHHSFAKTHGRPHFSTIELSYGLQVLWPEHCVQGTYGAAFASGLDIPQAELIIRKGYRPHVDSYSAFCEADRRTRTGLGGYLRERGIDRVFFVGLATDFCVHWSAVDARHAGFEAIVVEDACRAIDTQDSLAHAWTQMRAAGVERSTLATVPI